MREHVRSLDTVRFDLQNTEEKCLGRYTHIPFYVLYKSGRQAAESGHLSQPTVWFLVTGYWLLVTGYWFLVRW